MRAGDVIELTVDGEAVTAVVLLVNDSHVILDPFDGRTPVVLEHAELGDYRVFSPDLVAA